MFIIPLYMAFYRRDENLQQVLISRPKSPRTNAERKLLVGLFLYENFQRT